MNECEIDARAYYAYISKMAGRALSDLSRKMLVSTLDEAKRLGVSVCDKTGASRNLEDILADIESAMEKKQNDE